MSAALWLGIWFCVVWLGAIIAGWKPIRKKTPRTVFPRLPK